MLKRNLLAVLSIALIVFLTACEKPHDSGTNYKSKFVDGVLVEGERGKLEGTSEIGLKYSGKFDKNTGRITSGKIILFDGTVAEGKWDAKSEYLIQGKIEYADGSVAEGKFHKLTGYLKKGKKIQSGGRMLEGKWQQYGWLIEGKITTSDGYAIKGKPVLSEDRTSALDRGDWFIDGKNIKSDGTVDGPKKQSILGQAFESSMSFFSTKDKKRPFDGENLIVETPSENMLNSRGRFGVIIGADITPAIKEALNLGSSDGALVSDVEENSPAEKIGLKAGDVIISFNGVAIKEATDLPNAVGLMEIGNIYNITYLRKERKIENKIEIEAYSSPGFEQGVTLVEREGLLYIKFSSNPYTGSFSVYYENGKVSKTINVRDGLFDGPFIEYHENGQLQAKGSWKNGKYNDLYEEYYQSGEQKLKVFFTDGKFQECEGEGCASFKTVYNGKKLYEKSLKYLKENPEVAITAAKLGTTAACIMGSTFFCF